MCLRVSGVFCIGEIEMKDPVVSEFKRELKNLLDKHEVKLILSCEDMTAILSIDTANSVGNEICSQAESMHDETVVNDYLKYKEGKNEY